MVLCPLSPSKQSINHVFQGPFQAPYKRIERASFISNSTPLSSCHAPRARHIKFSTKTCNKIAWQDVFILKQGSLVTRSSAILVLLGRKGSIEANSFLFFPAELACVHWPPPIKKKKKEKINGGEARGRMYTGHVSVNKLFKYNESYKVSVQGLLYWAAVVWIFHHLTLSVCYVVPRRITSHINFSWKSTIKEPCLT